MEIRSTRPFNAIPATLNRGFFNLYLNLLYEIYFIVNSLFIYLFIHLFALSFSFNHCNFLLFCGEFNIHIYICSSSNMSLSDLSKIKSTFSQDDYPKLFLFLNHTPVTQSHKPLKQICIIGRSLKV